MSRNPLILFHIVLYLALILPSGILSDWQAAAISFVLATGLIAASVEDIRRYIIPDWSSLGLLLAGVVAISWMTPDQLSFHALAACGWFAVFGLISEVYFRWKGIDGLGLGDAKLMAAGAAWVGPIPSLSVLLVASLGGTCAALILMLRKRDAGTRGIAFGPFIALAIWVVWLYGPVT